MQIKLLSHLKYITIIPCFTDDKFDGKVRGNAFLSELQRAKIVDYIRDNDFGNKCFDQETAPLVKLDVWNQIWEYAKSIGILANKNPLENVSELRKTMREWRYKIRRSKKQAGTSGEGQVPQLSDVDQRYNDLIESCQGVAKGRKVSCIHIQQVLAIDTTIIPFKQHSIVCFKNE